MENSKFSHHAFGSNIWYKRWCYSGFSLSLSWWILNYSLAEILIFNYRKLTAPCIVALQCKDCNYHSKIKKFSVLKYIRLLKFQIKDYGQVSTLASLREISEHSAVNLTISLSYEFCTFLLYGPELKLAPKSCEYNPVEVFLLFLKASFLLFFTVWIRISLCLYLHCL